MAEAAGVRRSPQNFGSADCITRGSLGSGPCAYAEEAHSQLQQAVEEVP
jgi:hypothetical protein